MDEHGSSAGPEGKARSVPQKEKGFAWSIDKQENWLKPVCFAFSLHAGNVGVGIYPILCV